MPMLEIESAHAHIQKEKIFMILSVAEIFFVCAP